MKRTHDVEVIISLDADDPLLNKYLKVFPKSLVNKNRSAVDAINNAAKIATGEIMIVLSDDTECPRNWEMVVNKACDGKEDFVLKTFDGIQTWIVTMPILDRKYYNRYGYIYHPSYLHQFVDTHFTHVADVTKRIVWRNDILFPHRHKRVMDEVYRRSDQTWNHGKKTYIQMLKQNLGLDTSIDIMDLSHYGEDHKNWIRANVK